MAMKGLWPLPRRRESALSHGGDRDGRVVLPLARAAAVSTRSRVRPPADVGLVEEEHAATRGGGGRGVALVRVRGRVRVRVTVRVRVRVWVGVGVKVGVGVGFGFRFGFGFGFG